MERGRLPSLSPYDNETTRFIIPISTNWWIVSRLESFKLSSFPASYPYHAIEIISHPSFQRIRRRKKGGRETIRSGMVASGLPSLSFFRWWFSFSSPPPHFCADQTQRHSDLKKREGRVASHMTYGRSLQPRFPEIPSGYTGCISLTRYTHRYSCSPFPRLCSRVARGIFFPGGKGRMDSWMERITKGSRDLKGMLRNRDRPR